MPWAGGRENAGGPTAFLMVSEVNPIIYATKDGCILSLGISDHPLIGVSPPSKQLGVTLGG